MKNIKLSLKLFFAGYLVATFVGFATYYISSALMWISIFTLMPVIFSYLFYSYLKKTKCKKAEVFSETNRVASFWIILSFLVDALVYIIIVPIVYGHNSNWTFFMDQSPWIWLNYLTIIVLGHISRIIYINYLNKQELKNKIKQIIAP